MHEDLVKQAQEQQEFLLSQVETLIKLLYAAKDNNPHLQIWYAVSALEVYKLQSSLSLDAIVAGFVVTPEQMEQASEIRKALTQQLDILSDMVTPLLQKSS